MANEELGVWFNPRCLYDDPPPSVNCGWLHEDVHDRTRFIVQLLDDKTTFWCAKCETIVETETWTGCVRPERNTYSD